MNTKSIFASKTFYLNLIAILLTTLPVVKAWLETPGNASIGVMVVTVLNLLVRLMTDKGIAIWESGGALGDGSDGGARLPLWALIATAGSFAMVSLPSCSPAEREALKAVPLQACYIGEHGEKICYSTKDGVLVEVDRHSGK